MVNEHLSPVVLQASDGDHVVRYTRTLGQLSEVAIGRYALVGGFAVMVRLATAHRVT